MKSTNNALASWEISITKVQTAHEADREAQNDASAFADTGQQPKPYGIGPYRRLGRRCRLAAVHQPTW